MSRSVTRRWIPFGLFGAGLGGVYLLEEVSPDLTLQLWRYQAGGGISEARQVSCFGPGYGTQLHDQQKDNWAPVSHRAHHTSWTPCGV